VLNQTDQIDHRLSQRAIEPAVRVNFQPLYRESDSHGVPRPHIPVAAFGEANQQSKSLENVEYDDSSIIIIDDDVDNSGGGLDDFPELDRRLESNVWEVRLVPTIDVRDEVDGLESLFDLPLAITASPPASLFEEIAVADLPAFVIETDETEILRDIEVKGADHSEFARSEVDRDSSTHRPQATKTRELAVHQSYREAATEIEQLISRYAVKRILFAIAEDNLASHPTKYREYSTSFAYPIALALANDRRILLVDLASNSMCSDYGLAAGWGSSGIVQGICSPAEAVIATPCPRIDLLPRGELNAHHVEGVLLDSIRLATAINSLSREYDLVLITEAANALSKQSRLARAIDLALLLAPLGAVMIESLVGDRAHLEAIGIRPAGALLIDSSLRATFKTAN
jgi:hypothetical protein